MSPRTSPVPAPARPDGLEQLSGAAQFGAALSLLERAPRDSSYLRDELLAEANVRALLAVAAYARDLAEAINARA